MWASGRSCSRFKTKKKKQKVHVSMQVSHKNDRFFSPSPKYEPRLLNKGHFQSENPISDEIVVFLTGNR